MIQKLKRKCRPTTILLIVGFAISIASVLIGISTVNTHSNYRFTIYLQLDEHLITFIGV